MLRGVFVARASVRLGMRASKRAYLNVVNATKATVFHEIFSNLTGTRIIGPLMTYKLTILCNFNTYLGSQATFDAMVCCKR